MPELFDDGSDRLLDTFGIAEIAADGKGIHVVIGEGTDGGLGLDLRPEIGNGDVRAVFGEGKRNGTADALGSASYKHCLSRHRLIPIVHGLELGRSLRGRRCWVWW